MSVFGKLTENVEHIRKIFCAFSYIEAKFRSTESQMFDQQKKDPTISITSISMLRYLCSMNQWAYACINWMSIPDTKLAINRGLV
jgi:hypothetical protein